MGQIGANESCSYCRNSRSKVRDQLKANATRGLRERWDVFCERPVWTALGDWECVNTEDDLEVVSQYVNEAQDRMHLPKY